MKINHLCLSVVTALYDFHRAARDGKILKGVVRIFLLSDISKAFDRVQLDVLIQAIRHVLGSVGDDLLKAIISRIVFLYATGQILTTKDGKAVLILKLGGVHQGDPASPLLFAIVMEYARRLIPPRFRTHMRLYTSADGITTISMEIDYADDQVRVADSVREMTEVVAQLRRVLKIIGLEWNPSKVLLLALVVGAGRTVDVFDPLIASGNPQPNEYLKAVTKDDWFTILGVTTNWRGDSSEAYRSAADSELDVMTRIAHSPFPVHAKLWAFSTSVQSKSEFLYFNLWTPRKLVEELDCEERRFVRGIFGNINLPNALIMSDLKLSSRNWREEVVFLASLVRALGSKDPRVQIASRIMSKHACPDRMRGGPPLEPPFFDWGGPLPTERCRPGLLNVPTRYAMLAHKWNVGFQESEGKLVVSHKGKALENPHNLLSILSKAAMAACKQRLLDRISTDKNKSLAAENATNWGQSAWKMTKAARCSLTNFYGEDSTFTDHEISILTQLRLRLWPTAMRDSVRSGGKDSALCKCGSVQTDTHILLVPFRNTCNPDATPVHSLELRTIPNSRHADAIKRVLGPLFNNLESWTVVAVESLPPSEHMEHVREIISQAAADGHLSNKGLPALAGKDLPGAQHWKPDIIIGRRVRSKTELLIYDVCFAADDKLRIEDEILAWRRKKQAANKRNHEPHCSLDRWLQSDHFDPLGAFTDKGIGALDSSLAEKAKTLSVFHPARYAQRYSPLQKVLKRSSLQLDGNPVVRTLAIGVGGWVPDYTMHHLTRLRQEQGAMSELEIRNKLCLNAQIWAVRAFRAWQREGM